MAVEVDGGDDVGEGVGAAGDDLQAAPQEPRGPKPWSLGVSQNTPRETLVLSLHDDPFVGKLGPLLLLLCACFHMGPS